MDFVIQLVPMGDRNSLSEYLDKAYREDTKPVYSFSDSYNGFSWYVSYVGF